VAISSGLRVGKELGSIIVKVANAAGPTFDWPGIKGEGNVVAIRIVRLGSSTLGSAWTAENHNMKVIALTRPSQTA
jgi:hypothetical protein